MIGRFGKIISIISFQQQPNGNTITFQAVLTPGPKLKKLQACQDNNGLPDIIIDEVSHGKNYDQKNFIFHTTRQTARMANIQ